ncbi:hypothetical protein BASA81_007400 [Batrachochytrium salamandrivorans]|nr:hypothetical protein BASA81_007400 [Batrachochytrium salamandrivorans]
MDCPVCGKRKLAEELETHVEFCLNAAAQKRPKLLLQGPDKPNAFAVLMANARPAGKPKPPPVVITLEEDEEDLFEEEEVPPSKNAFAVLMRSAKDRAMIETFTFDFLTGLCTWTNTPQSSSNGGGDWHGTAKLGRGTDSTKIRLVGKNLPQALGSGVEIAIKSRLPVGTLKSIMQKSYRRMDLDNFRKSASELANKSWTDFIRRLPIVLLEDGYCPNQFASLVWLMLADSCSNGGEDDYYRNRDNTQMALFCINLVTFQDTRVDDFSIVPTLTNNRELGLLSNPTHAAQVFAMRARGMFGGMKCDVDMCNAYAAIWYDRFAKGELPSNTIGASSPPLHQLVGFSDSCEIPSAGVDTHCQPLLFEPLLVKCPELNQAMWRFRGGLNLRTLSPQLAQDMERGCSPNLFEKS